MWSTFLLPRFCVDFRLELSVLLKKKSSFIENSKMLTSDVTAVDYEQLTIDKLDDPVAIEIMLDDYATNPAHENIKIYLVSTV